MFNTIVTLEENTSMILQSLCIVVLFVCLFLYSSAIQNVFTNVEKNI